jgi:hypothetical protein
MGDEILEKHDAGLAYVIRTRHHDDETALILKGHLLVEFLLDKIIEEKLRDSSKIKKISLQRETSNSVLGAIIIRETIQEHHTAQ